MIGNVTSQKKGGSSMSDYTVISSDENSLIGIFRIGPDRAYPLHFTRPQLLLLLLLPVLLPVLLLLPLLCVCDRAYPLYFTHPQLLLLLLFFYLFGPYPLK